MKKFMYIKNAVRAHAIRYISGILFFAVSSVCQLMIPRLTGKIIDGIKSGAFGFDLLRFYSLIILLLILCALIALFFWRFCLIGATRQIENDIREMLYEKIMKLPQDFFARYKTGDIITRFISDASSIQLSLCHGVTNLLNSVVIPLTAIAMMLEMAGFELTLAAVTPLGIMTCVIYFYMQRMYGKTVKMQSALSNLTESVRESIAGIRVVKAFVREKNRNIKFKKNNQAAKTANIRYLLMQTRLQPLMTLFSSMTFAISIGFGGVLVLEGKLTLGELIAFNGFLTLMISPVSGLSVAIGQIQKGLVGIERINDILMQKERIIDEDENKLEAFQFDTIEFDNVSFGYNSKQVLKDISFTVHKGETIGVIGRTGMGKTTLAQLLMRVYDPDEGQIRLNGMDVKLYNMVAYRQKIGYVPQETFLFSKSIGQNIDFYMESTMESILNSSNLACLDQEVLTLPEGFDTVLAERGGNLSGGQCQRLAIARAINRNPEVFVFDDSLSALDAKTEDRLITNLNKLGKSTICFIISHKVRSIKHANLILVLDKGRVIESGSHESLIRSRGLYYKFYVQQNRQA